MADSCHTAVEDMFSINKEINEEKMSLGHILQSVIGQRKSVNPKKLLTLQSGLIRLESEAVQSEDVCAWYGRFLERKKKLIVR